MKNFLQKGITALELIIVMAILVILIMAVLPKFSEMKNNQLLKNTEENVLATLNTARTQTLASLNSSGYGVHFQSDKIVLFAGLSYSPSDPSNKVFDMISPATISGINLGGSSEIIFEKLSGTPSAYGDIVVSVGSLSKTITITRAGAIGIN